MYLVRQRFLEAVRSAVVVSALLMLGFGLIGTIDLTDHRTVAIVWSFAAGMWFVWELVLEPVVDRALERLVARRRHRST